MPVEFKPLDISELLDSEEMIAGFLSAAAEDEDPNVLIGALMHAAKAHGMMQVAKATGLNRESLYKALKPGAHPRFETVQAVLRALGVKFSVAARQATDDPGRDGDEMRRLEKVVENKILQPVEKRSRGHKGRAETAGKVESVGKVDSAEPKGRHAGGRA